MLEGHGLVVDLTVQDYQLDLMISAVFSNLSDSMILCMLIHKHSAPPPENVPACTVYIYMSRKIIINSKAVDLLHLSDKVNTLQRHSAHLKTFPGGFI